MTRALAILTAAVVTACAESPSGPARLEGRVLAGGAPAEGVVVTASASQVHSALTGPDGQYAFDGLSPGSYAVVPGVLEGAAVFSPPSATVTLASDGLHTLDFDLNSWDRVSRVEVQGTVAYSGKRRGRVFVQLRQEAVSPGLAGWGTSLDAPGAFTIRGVPPGRYYAVAFLDYLGATDTNRNAPAASLPAFEIGPDGLADLHLELVDPPEVSPRAPLDLQVFPLEGAASVQFEGQGGGESAEFYNLYWSTSPDPGPGQPEGGGVAQIPPWPGNQRALYVQYGLPDGEELWFAVSEQVGDVEGPLSNVWGPVRIGAVKGGHAISGSVAFDGVEPRGTLVLSVESARFVEPYHQQWTRIAAPMNPQPFRIEGLPDGRYMLIVSLDEDGDGNFWDGDPSEEMFDGTRVPMLEIRGSNIERHVVFTPVRGDRRVTVMRERRDDLSDRYVVSVEGREMTNIPVRGAAWVPTVGPIDLSGRRFDDRDGLIYGFELDVGAVRPPPTPWRIDMGWYDGVSDSFEAPPMPLDALPEDIRVGPGFAISWSIPDSAPAGHTVRVRVLEGGELRWDSTALPPGTTAITYGATGSAQPLVAGRDHELWVELRDAEGNVARSVRAFAP